VPDRVVEFIVGGRVARLGTADATGQPHVVPICYAFDGATFFSAVDAKPKRTPAAGLRRVRNIRENPRVSIVVDEYDEDWSRLRYVIVQGEARILTAGAAYRRGVELLLEKYPQYATLPLDREVGTMIAVTPDRMAHWSFRA
jgi:PPOX class probable F420-dependent enzyme